jgi:hypothetical protein
VRLIENSKISSNILSKKFDRSEMSVNNIDTKFIENSQISDSQISNKIISENLHKSDSNIDTKSIENSQISDSQIKMSNILQNEPKLKNISDTDLGFFNFATSSKSDIGVSKIDNSQNSDNKISEKILDDSQQSPKTENIQTNILSNDNLLKLYINNIGNIEQSPIEEILKRVAYGSLGNARERNERDSKNNKSEDKA